MSAPESLHSNTGNTVEAADALAGMRQGPEWQQRPAPPGGPARGPAGAGPNGGSDDEGGGAEAESSEEQPHLVDLAGEPKPPKMQRSEWLRYVAKSLKRLAPKFREHPMHPESDQYTVSQVKAIIGGAAPQYQEQGRTYLRELLQWPLQGNASLEGCFVLNHLNERCVDLARLHAAGCFPHTWTFPLTLADMQAANWAAQAIYDQGPEGREHLLQEALAAVAGSSAGGGRGRGKRTARAVSDEEEAEEEAEAAGAKRHERAQGKQQLRPPPPKSSGDQRARNSPGPGAAAAHVPALLQRRTAVLERRSALVLRALCSPTPAENDIKQSILQLLCAAGLGCQLLQGVLGRWGQLRPEQQGIIYEVARQVAIAQPPAWEQLQDNLETVLDLEGVVLPRRRGSRPADAAPAAAASEPNPLLQRVQEKLVEALEWDPEQPGPANNPDPRCTPFSYLKAYLQHGATPAAEFLEGWSQYSEARRQWLLDELVLVAAEGAWVHLGARLRQALHVPVDGVQMPNRDPRRRP